MLDQAATPKVLGKKLRDLFSIPGSLPPDLARLVELLEKQDRAKNVRRSDLGGRISGS
jgi:hypothetical protein